jgi:hypothetical protein
VEAREPTIEELRVHRERVRDTHEDLTWTLSRLQRLTMGEAERDTLVREWEAGNPDELARLIQWRAQALREEEARLVDRVGGAFDPIACLDGLVAALDGDEPPTRYQLRDELAYVVRELRRSGSSTRVC